MMEYREIVHKMSLGESVSYEEVTDEQLMMLYRDRYIKLYHNEFGEFEINIVKMTPDTEPTSFTRYYPDTNGHTSHKKICELLDCIVTDSERKVPIRMVLENEQYEVVVEQLESA
jgi:hypothetical protein